MISKTSRQLAILHIFLCSKVIEFLEITNLIKVSHRTIIRDLKELKNTGLINVRFSRKEKGYVHMDDYNRCPFLEPVFSDNKAQNMHLEKLIRLVTIMICLRHHTEIPYYEDDYSTNQETCSSWYKKRFPNLSTRTMARDFVELNKIGYLIRYCRFDKCYEVNFPDGLEGISFNYKY